MKSTTIIIFAAIFALCLVAEGNPMPKALYRPGRVMGGYGDESYHEPRKSMDHEEENDDDDADEDLADSESDPKR